MSILLVESDKTSLAIPGLQGGIMLDDVRRSERVGPQDISAKEFVARREGARRSAPADQLMYAWSMSATRTTADKKVETFRGKEECPPEVYLG